MNQMIQMTKLKTIVIKRIRFATRWKTDDKFFLFLLLFCFVYDVDEKW